MQNVNHFLTHPYWGFNFPIASRSWLSTAELWWGAGVSGLGGRLRPAVSTTSAPLPTLQRPGGELHTPVSSMTDASSPSNDGFFFFFFFNTLQLGIFFFPPMRRDQSVEPAVLRWLQLPLGEKEHLMWRDDRDKRRGICPCRQNRKCLTALLKRRRTGSGQ